MVGQQSVTSAVLAYSSSVVEEELAQSEGHKLLLRQEVTGAVCALLETTALCLILQQRVKH